MTAKDWKKAEESCKSIYGYGCDLCIAGRTVSIRRVQVSEGKLKLMTYIDGKFNGKWLIDDVPERQYLFHGTACIVKRSELAKIKSAKRRKEIQEYYSYETISPYWGSFRTLKSQYRQRFGDDEIELLINANE